MATIIAGQFDTHDKATRAVRSLQQQGVSKDAIAVFFVGAPGQHSLTPIGGDSMADAGAKNAGVGGVTGAILGAAVGGVLGAVTGEFVSVSNTMLVIGGIATGMFTGSLIGAMLTMRDGRRVRATEEHPKSRDAGMIVATRIDEPVMEATATTTLRAGGAVLVERTQGELRNGRWVDFDPTEQVNVVAGKQKS